MKIFRTQLKYNIIVNLLFSNLKPKSIHENSSTFLFSLFERFKEGVCHTYRLYNVSNYI